jgi:D-amino-acid dehydrogenase
MSRSVVVIGGGLVGLSTALMLQQRGASVTVIDSNELGSGAAKGNAGYMCTSLVAPLAAPGQIKKAITSIRDPYNPLRVRPSAVPGMIGWGLRFAKASTTHAYEEGRAALVRFNAHNAEVLNQFKAAGIEFELGETIMAPFHSEAFGHHFIADLKPLAEFGIKVPTELLSGHEMRAMMPAITDHVTCGIVIETDHTIDPRAFTDALIDRVKRNGATVVEHATVETVSMFGGEVRSVSTNKGTFVADEYVLAAGAGSKRIGKLFGIKVPVVPGTGYNVALPPMDTLTRSVIFEEPRVAVTPLGDCIRLGGTMEFGGENPSFDQRRVDAITASLKKYLHVDMSKAFNTWSGGRPLTPDGLPIIGKPKSSKNLTVAAGHGMFGLTLAPATGKAVAELITEGRAQSDLTPFTPDRFKLF